MKALVVDDEPGVRRATARQLEAMGFEVKQAEGAGAAAQALADWTPDTIVCDGMMPGLNGRDLHDGLVPDLRRKMIFFTAAHGTLFEGLSNAIVQKPDYVGLKVAVAQLTGARIS